MCELTDNHDGTFRLGIRPKEAGRHVLQIKYGGEHVQGNLKETIICLCRAGTDCYFDRNKLQICVQTCFGSAGSMVAFILRKNNCWLC